MQSDQFQLHCDIELRHWWFVARRRIISDLVRQLVTPQSDRVRQATIIDVGCGTGANAAALADDYHCVGIDTSPEAIQLAAGRFPNVDFRAGFAPDDLGDCMSEAKLITLNDVLEHVPDDFELLSKLLAASSPGAYFLVTVPANMELWSQHDESFGHYRRYSLERLARVWRGLAVNTVMLTYFNSRLYPLIRLIRSRNRQRGKAAGRVGTDFEIPSALTNRALEIIFAGERHRLLRLAAGKTNRRYSFGVSLLAVLRRGAGPIQVRTRPADVKADFFNPSAVSSANRL